MRKCFDCDRENEDAAVYCVKCGTPLDPKVYSRLLARAAKKQTAPRSYPALRFISGFFVFFGWVYILFGWLMAISTGSVVSQLIASTFDISMPYMSLFIAVFLGVMSTAFGFIFIASGEVFSLMLDIGGDIRAIREK